MPRKAKSTEELEQQALLEQEFAEADAMPDETAEFTSEGDAWPEETAQADVLKEDGTSVEEGAWLEETPFPEVEDTGGEPLESTADDAEVESYDDLPDAVMRDTPPEEPQPAASENPVPEPAPAAAEDASAPARTTRRRRSASASRSVLAIDDAVQVQSAEEKEAYLWMELRNSLRSKRILTGVMGGVERTPGGTPIAVVYYKEMRIVIPASEMFLNLNEHGGGDQRELNSRYAQILTRMLGAELDFVVSGLDRRGGSVVAGRRAAMLRKQQHYFLSPGRTGSPLVNEGQVVEARVISVGEKNMRVEVFGVEATVLARDIAWEWVDDCADYHQIGDHVLVKILRVDRDDSHNLRVGISVRDAIPNPARDNIKKCAVQGKYIGKVTGVDTRAIYVRLNVGVNAIAIAVHDRKTPCRKDDVSFVITRIDEEAGLAIGIITKVIKQYL